MKKLKFFTTLLLATLFLNSSALSAASSKAVEIVLSANYEEVGYSKPSSLTKEEWEQVQPFLLPLDHPAKQVLDLIHKKIRMTTSFETIILAGFRVIRENSRGMIVAEHPKMPGYLIKTVLDDDRVAKPDWVLWHRRALGAAFIEANIEKNHFEKWLKVPKKWLYPIPNECKPRQGQGIYPKQFILVVEKMDVYDHKQNKKKYRHEMTREKLKALYTVLTEERLYDSMFIDNAGFCKDGKMAFIDTEYYHDKRALKYEKLNGYLSSDLLSYWKQLTNQR